MGKTAFEYFDLAGRTKAHAKYAAEERSELDKARSVATGGAVAAGVGTGANVAGNLYSKNRFAVGPTQRDVALNKELMGKHPEIRFHTTPEVKSNAFYVPNRHLSSGQRELLENIEMLQDGPIGVATKPETKGRILAGGELTSDLLAHELGHAKHDKSRVGKVTQSVKGRRAALVANPLTSAVLGAALSDSDSPYATAAAGAVPALMHAPTLVSEGAASLNALKLLRGAGASKKEVAKAGLRLLPAYATYAGNAALSAGAGAGTQAYYKSKRLEDKENAEATKQSSADSFLRTLETPNAALGGGLGAGIGTVGGALVGRRFGDTLGGASVGGGLGTIGGTLIGSKVPSSEGQEASRALRHLSTLGTLSSMTAGGTLLGEGIGSLAGRPGRGALIGAGLGAGAGLAAFAAGGTPYEQALAKQKMNKEAMGPLLSGGRAVMSRIAPVAGKAIGKVAPGVGNKVSKWGKSLMGNNMTSKGNSLGAIAKETINPLNWA